jgi:hypothetical protein
MVVSADEHRLRPSPEQPDQNSHLAHLAALYGGHSRLDALSIKPGASSTGFFMPLRQLLYRLSRKCVGYAALQAEAG